MNHEGGDDRHRARRELEKKIVARQERKIRARQQGERSTWFGLGMFGLVGWSVAVPTLLGIAVGLWIDRRWPSQFSWTLMLLMIGVAVGCLNAWWWIQREIREPDDEEETRQEDAR